VRSSPGSTVFRASLPIAGPPESDASTAEAATGEADELADVHDDRRAAAAVASIEVAREP
jgi:hypothetical protein